MESSEDKLTWADICEAAEKQEVEAKQQLDFCKQKRLQWQCEQQQMLEHPPKDYSVSTTGIVECDGCHRKYEADTLCREKQAMGCCTGIMRTWSPENPSAREIVLFGTYGSMFAEHCSFLVKELPRYLQRFGLPPVDARDKEKELNTVICDLCLYDMLKENIIIYLGHDNDTLSAEWAYYIYHDYWQEAQEIHENSSLELVGVTTGCPRP